MLYLKWYPCKSCSRIPKINHPIHQSLGDHLYTGNTPVHKPLLGIYSLSCSYSIIIQYSTTINRFSPTNILRYPIVSIVILFLLLLLWLLLWLLLLLLQILPCLLFLPLLLLLLYHFNIAIILLLLLLLLFYYHHSYYWVYHVNHISHSASLSLAHEVLTFTLTSQVIGTLQIPITLRILGQNSASILEYAWYICSPFGNQTWLAGKPPNSMGKIGAFPASHVWFTEGMEHPQGFHQKKFPKRATIFGRVQKQPMLM